PAAQHARLSVGRIVEHAGLTWRHTVFAGDEIDFYAVGAAAEPGRPRRARRAYPYEHLVPAGAERPPDGAPPHPVYGAHRPAPGAGGRRWVRSASGGPTARRRAAAPSRTT